MSCLPIHLSQVLCGHCNMSLSIEIFWNAAYSMPSTVDRSEVKTLSNNTSLSTEDTACHDGVLMLNSYMLCDFINLLKIISMLMCFLRRLYWGHEERVWSELWLANHRWQWLSTEVLCKVGVFVAAWTARCHSLYWPLLLSFVNFLADRTNGRAHATVLRLSSVVCDIMYCG